MPPCNVVLVCLKSVNNDKHYLYTRPLEIAREAGCPMPKLEMLEAELRFLEDGV
jgi:hypothetical protein